MNGPQHYREGERHLSAASHLDKPGGLPADRSAAAYHLAAAQTQLADRYVGDGPHINDWRNATGDDPWSANQRVDATPRIPGTPYSPTVETTLRNLSLAGHITPADTLAAAIPVIAGHVAEAIVDGQGAPVRNWARSLIDELKRAGLDLRGSVEQRVEDLNGGTPFNWDAPAWNDDPPF
jgi:hypothetical protein